MITVFYINTNNYDDCINDINILNKFFLYSYIRYFYFVTISLYTCIYVQDLYDEVS